MRKMLIATAAVAALCLPAYGQSRNTTTYSAAAAQDVLADELADHLLKESKVKCGGLSGSERSKCLAEYYAAVNGVRIYPHRIQDIDLAEVNKTIDSGAADAQKKKVLQDLLVGITR